MYTHDNITAIATPPGIGAIATIRLSGPDAISIFSKIWNGKKIDQCNHASAHLGYLIDNNGDEIDQVIATIFRAPNSFTGLDTIEISCHGSKLIQQNILNELCLAGARIANPGEFSQQAFLNGKIDLTQAEGIADLIAAQSDAARRLALQHTKGAFSKNIDNLRNKLIEIASLLELELDFSEEDVTFADRTQLKSLATDIKLNIDNLAKSFRNGQIIKEGIPIVIAGAPNAGKSTLLNTIIGHQRAIVSDIPGTTRDTIEEKITREGQLFRLIDTAGIRQTDDPIEILGIDRTIQNLDTAAETLWLIDPNTPIQPQTTPLLNHINRHPDTPTTIIITKTDITDPGPASEQLRQTLSQNQHSPLTNQITALSNTDAKSVDTLLHTITRRQTSVTAPDATITNLRHYQSLTRASATLDALLAGIDAALSADLLAQDLRETLHHLGTLTGVITTTDLLHSIFSRFCIGK